eukprot:3698770-Rhodomonas_salina.1
MSAQEIAKPTQSTTLAQGVAIPTPPRSSSGLSSTRHVSAGHRRPHASKDRGADLRRRIFPSHAADRSPSPPGTSLASLPLDQMIHTGSVTF